MESCVIRQEKSKQKFVHRQEKHEDGVTVTVKLPYEKELIL